MPGLIEDNSLYTAPPVTTHRFGVAEAVECILVQVDTRKK